MEEPVIGPKSVDLCVKMIEVNMDENKHRGSASKLLIDLKVLQFNKSNRKIIPLKII